MARTPVNRATSLLSSLRLSALLCALLLSPCHGSPQKPEITTQPTDAYIFEGGAVSFRCDVTAFPLPVVKWYKDGGALDSGRVEYLDDQTLVTTLVIQGARSADSGQYTCEATNMMGRVQASAHLYVGNPLVFLEKSEDQSVRVGERVNLTCRVMGSPSPTVFWREHGQEGLFFPTSIPERRYVNVDGDLIMDPVRMTDAGRYTCTALNSNEMVSATTSLSVTGTEE